MRHDRYALEPLAKIALANWRHPTERSWEGAVYPRLSQLSYPR